MAKVSIIVPVYNVENYVRKTIDSVINQTESDIEIILIDDGSTDASGKICDEYESKDKRIKVIHQENSGLSSARNEGTKKATSKYVMYLDGDDYLKENAVSRAFSVMEKYPSDFVQYRYKEVEEGMDIIQQKEEGLVYQVYTSKDLFENLYELGGMAASGATKLIRRELMLKIPYISIRHEDEMWCTQAFQHDLTATYITDELYYYVMRKNSIIHSKFNSEKLDIFYIMDYRIKVLEELGLYDLLAITYHKVFVLIVGLYLEATKVKDKISMNKIQLQFVKHKNEIRKYAHLDLKFKILFGLMNIDFNFIKLYKVYKNLTNMGHVDKWGK